MGLIRVVISGITSSNDFRVYYKQDMGYNTPYPLTGVTWIEYGLYSGGTTVVRFDENIINFINDQVYWIKIEDVDNPKQYLIKNIKIHGDQFCPDILVTPTVTPSISLTPSITPSLSLSPSITPSIVVDISPSVTPTRTATRTVTPSISLTPTRTPSITQSVVTAGSDIYVEFNDDGVLVFTGVTDQTLTVTLWTQARAYADSGIYGSENPWSINSDISIYQTNGLVHTDSAEAIVYTKGQDDDDIVSSTTDVNYISSGTIVDVRASGQCLGDPNVDYDQGSSMGDAQIMAVTITAGTIVPTHIGHNNCWTYQHYYDSISGCTEFMYAQPCTIPTPSVTPSITRPTPSVSETLVPVFISNQCTSHDYYITGITIGNGVAVYEYPDANAIGPGDSITENFHGNGTYSLSIGIASPGGYTSEAYIIVIDSTGTIQNPPRVIDSIPKTIGDYYGVPFTSTGGVSITMYDGLAPSLTPSVTVTPFLTPTITPTITPSVSQPQTEWYYNVDFYDCDGLNCSALQGSDNINVSQELIVGNYYLSLTGTQVIYVDSETSSSVNLYSVSGGGYGTCQNACTQI